MIQNIKTSNTTLSSYKFEVWSTLWYKKDVRVNICDYESKIRSGMTSFVCCNYRMCSKKIIYTQGMVYGIDKLHTTEVITHIHV